MAVRPSDEARSVIEALGHRDDPGVRWVPDDQWHVTLRFWPEASIQAVRALVDGVAAVRPPGFSSATARLGPQVERLGPSAIVIPVSGLDLLAAAVSTATELTVTTDRADSASSVGSHGRPPFRGHLTLGRFRGRPRRGASTSLLGAPIDCSFPVHEIELVHSELTPSGAIHHVIATWPLPA